MLAVGAVVHYTADDTQKWQCAAAMVLREGEGPHDTTRLRIFSREDGRSSLIESADWDEDRATGTWHYVHLRSDTPWFEPPREGPPPPPPPPPVEEPPPAEEQPPAEENPPAEEPPAEQPPAEEPPAEEPPAEEPPAEGGTPGDGGDGGDEGNPPADTEPAEQQPPADGSTPEPGQPVSPEPVNDTEQQQS